MRKLILFLGMIFLIGFAIAIWDYTVVKVENYETIGSDGGAVGMGMQFTLGTIGINRNYTLDGVSWYVKVVNSGGTACNYTIWQGAVTSNVAVISNTTNCVEQQGSGNKWVNISFANYKLVQSTAYTITVFANGGAIGTAQQTTGTYTGGDNFYCSGGCNNGAAWTPQATIDTPFIIWGHNDTLSYFLNLNNPNDNYVSGINEIVFNCSTGTAPAQVVNNISLFLDGIRNYTVNNGATNYSEINISRYRADGSHNWSCNSYVSGILLNSSVRTLTVNTITPQSTATFNTTTYETSNENFIATVIYNPARWSSISANLIVNNSGSYAGTKIGSGSTIQFYKSLPISVNNPPQNVSFVWNILVTNSTGTYNFTSATYYQYVNRTLFGLCNATIPTRYLNVSFRDEANGNLINASIPTSTFVYWLGDGSVNKTYTFISNTEFENYTFCFSPSDRTVNTLNYIQYKATSYPQRIFNQLLTLTNTTTEKILYLLSSTDGIYVTFQVTNTADALISGVEVTANRTIGSSVETIAYGITGSDGLVTFWLNPDFYHTFLFSKSGYNSYSTSFYPTQTSYTITIGGTTGGVLVDYQRGTSYSFSPKQDFLERYREYSFNFTTATSIYSFSSFGFGLYYPNGTLITTQSSTSATGGTVSYTFNTSNFSYIKMNAYYVINSTTYNFTRVWKIQTSGNVFSIAHFFQDLTLYINANIFGINGEDGTSNFGRGLICVLILVFVAGSLTYRYGIASEAAIMGVVFGLILFFDVGLGLIQLDSSIGAVQHFPTIVTGLLMIAFIFREEGR